jgi:hypothetical protein
LKTFREFRQEAAKNTLDQNVQTLQIKLNQFAASFGVKIQFSNHFTTQMNNRDLVNMDEINDLFQKMLKKYTKFFSKLTKNESEAVIKDLTSTINIPIVIRKIGNHILIIAKTIIKKQNFFTTSKVLKLKKENIHENTCNVLVCDVFNNDFRNFLHYSFS